ncbi:hypothetical protein D3C73_1534790 [compost metagenome]
MQAIRVRSDVLRKEGQEGRDGRIVVVRRVGARQKDFSAGPDAVVKLVAFAEPERFAHGIGNGGLVAVSQGRFNFQGRRHGGLLSGMLGW